MTSMFHERTSLTGRLVRWSLLVSLIVLVALGAFRFALYAKERNEFGRLHKQIYSIIDGLRHRRPVDVERATWEDLVDRTLTAYANVCFSDDHVGNSEMARLHSDLRAKMGNKINTTTLVWVWDRLEKTGPHGKRYVRRFRPQFLDAVKTATGRETRGKGVSARKGKGSGAEKAIEIGS